MLILLTNKYLHALVFTILFSYTALSDDYCKGYKYENQTFTWGINNSYVDSVLKSFDAKIIGNELKEKVRVITYSTRAGRLSTYFENDQFYGSISETYMGKDEKHAETMYLLTKQIMNAQYGTTKYENGKSWWTKDCGQNSIKLYLERGFRNNQNIVEIGIFNEKKTVPINEQFILAVKQGDITQVKGLISQGANVNAVPIGEEYIRGTTPLMLAVQLKKYNMVELLLDNNADINAQDNNGESALMYTESSEFDNYEREKIVKYLLDKGANPNLTDEFGCTYLFTSIATGNGYEGVVKLLLEHKADATIKNNDGKTALMIAKQKGFKNIENLLKKAGAKK